jgi:predicted ester cyclase
MTAEDNGALVRRSIEELWNRGDLSVADDVFAPDYVLHTLYEADAAGLSGPLGVRQRVHMRRAALHDLRITIDDLVAAGDRVVTRWSGRGKFGEDHWWGTPATGKVVTWTAVLISRVAGGKIAEEWLLWGSPRPVAATGRRPAHASVVRAVGGVGPRSRRGVAWSR